MKPKTTGLRMRSGTIALGLALVAMGPRTGTAQVAVGQAVACPVGMEVGDIGISGLDCVGECTFTVREDGSERSWFFSTEPRVLGVLRGGAAEGVLESGDFLVAVDGLLITSKEGGERYANLEPGEQVRIRYRRDGRVREGAIRVEQGCLDPPKPAGVASRVPPPPPLPDQSVPVDVAVAPRVRVAPTRGARGSSVTSTARATARTTVPRGTRAGILESVSPGGSLGIGISCTNCGTQRNEETGEEVWFFSGPLEVSAVDPGGPAARVGIQRGDLIKAINGNALDTEAGGVAFTRLRAGESVRVTVVKRTGAEIEIEVVPEARRRVAPPTPLAGQAPAADPAPLAPPAVRSLSEVHLDPNAPEGMPLRYSGTLGGVEVEIRGAPVMVSEVEDTRTLYINADGLWIRITVPRRTPLPEGGDKGLPGLELGGLDPGGLDLGGLELGAREVAGGTGR